RATTALIDRGARVMVASAEQTSDNEALDYALAHAACFAMIERSAFVANAFVIYGKQIMGVRPAYRRLAENEDGDLPTVEQLTAKSALAPGSADGAPYWQEWPRKFDYLYLMYTRSDEANPLPEFLTLVHTGSRFQLYRIRRSAP